MVFSLFCITAILNRFTKYQKHVEISILILTDKEINNWATYPVHYVVLMTEGHSFEQH